MSVAARLAARIIAMRYEDLTPEAVYWSKVAGGLNQEMKQDG